MENYIMEILRETLIESIMVKYIDRFSRYSFISALHFRRICSNDQRRSEHKVRDRLCEQFLIE